MILLLVLGRRGCREWGSIGFGREVLRVLMPASVFAGKLVFILEEFLTVQEVLVAVLDSFVHY